MDLKRGQIVIERTKANKSLRIPIADALVPILEGAMDASGTEHVFVNARGVAYTVDSFSAQWRLAVKAAKIRNFRFHDCRHTFATRVRRAGHGLDVLKDLLGHSTILLSNRYAHVGAEQLRDAVAGLTVGA